MTKYQNAIAAAKEYLEGQRLKQEISELSARTLAVKFDVPRKAVLMIQNGMTPTSLLHDDVKLIRECIAHRRKLEGVYAGKTLEAVAAKYHVAKTTVKSYLEDLA